MRTCRICGEAGDHPSWRARDMRRSSEERFDYFQYSGCGCLQIEEMPKSLSGYYTDDYYSFKDVSKRKLVNTSGARAFTTSS